LYTKPKTLKICSQLTVPFQTVSKRHKMSPGHFEIHALICANIYFILLSTVGSLTFFWVLLFNRRILFINCHKPKKIPMLHYQLVAIYMSKGLIKTAAVSNSHSNFPTPTSHTHTYICTCTHAGAHLPHKLKQNFKYKFLDHHHINIRELELL
jgi:hypothetical protein